MAGQNSDITILHWLFEHRDNIDTAGLETLSEWKKLFDGASTGWDTPVDRAVIGGFLGDRTAYAFAAGYESALRRLVPALPGSAIVSFCVTEEKGGHPSSIRSTLKEGGPGGPWILNGSKKFITMVNDADLLLAAASTGTSPEGRNSIRMALVERNAPGVTVSVMTGLPFVPEISHGTVSFSDVPVKGDSVLPGDGYSGYIKPFRTIEDIHIFAAVAGYIFRTACLHLWPRTVIEETAAVITCARALALDSPSSPAVHIALAGLHRQFTALLESASGYWDLADEKTRAWWERDRALLDVAGKARGKRLETAWSRLG